MLDSDCKQGLSGETLGNDNGEMPRAASAFVITGMLAALALYWGIAAIVAASAPDRNFASGRYDSPMLKKQHLAVKAEPEGREQRQGEEDLIQIYIDWIQAEHGRVGLYVQDAPRQERQYLAGNAEPEGKEQQQSEASKKEPEGNVQDLTY
jgi:hypothetical protein